MYNFALYEIMTDKGGENRTRWEELQNSGLQLVSETLNQFRLPPNTLNVIEGRVVSNEQVFKEIRDGGEVSNLIPEAARKMAIGIPAEDERVQSIWGFDAMRIPFRLSDTSSVQAVKLAEEIWDRLEAVGGAKTKYGALTGENKKDGERAAVVEAPLALVSSRKLGSKEKAVEKVHSSMTNADNQVLYWQEWRALGLLQLKGNST